MKIRVSQSQLDCVIHSTQDFTQDPEKDLGPEKVLCLKLGKQRERERPAQPASLEERKGTSLPGTSLKTICSKMLKNFCFTMKSEASKKNIAKAERNCQEARNDSGLGWNPSRIPMTVFQRGFARRVPSALRWTGSAKM